MQEWYLFLNLFRINRRACVSVCICLLEWIISLVFKLQAEQNLYWNLEPFWQSRSVSDWFISMNAESERWCGRLLCLIHLLIHNSVCVYLYINNNKLSIGACMQMILRQKARNCNLYSETHTSRRLRRFQYARCSQVYCVVVFIDTSSSSIPQNHLQPLSFRWVMEK